MELAPIRVNAVSPGVVRTNLWQSMSAAERSVTTWSLSSPSTDSHVAPQQEWQHDAG